MAKWQSTKEKEQAEIVKTINEDLLLKQKDHFKHLQKINRSILESKNSSDKRFEKLEIAFGIFFIIFIAQLVYFTTK